MASTLLKTLFIKCTTSNKLLILVRTLVLTMSMSQHTWPNILHSLIFYLLGSNK